MNREASSRLLAGFAALGLGLLGAASLVHRGLGMVLLREDFTDFRFYPLAYPGRLCESLLIEASASRGRVALTNGGSHALNDLVITMKFFAGSERVLVERQVERLDAGCTLVIGDDDPALGLKASVRTDLGMLYVRASCDRGVAVARGWWSYWN